MTLKKDPFSVLWLIVNNGPNREIKFLKKFSFGIDLSVFYWTFSQE